MTAHSEETSCAVTAAFCFRHVGNSFQCFYHKYVDIYADKSNPADECGGGADEERREALRDRLLQK